MIIETLSTFPHMYDSVMNASMMKIAQDKGILDFAAYDLRDWTHDRHRTTDDSPYGGGEGLVMKCEPIFEAFRQITGAEPYGAHDLSDDQPKTGMEPRFANAVAPKIVFLVPGGRTLNEALVNELASCERLLFICGHYEGIDERAYALADYEISLGDFVLTSGELASMVVIDAVVRKLDGVLGAAEGAANESFAAGLLEHPQYTRPRDFEGAEVPAILLSGDHAKVAQWKREQALLRTAEKRPDLLDGIELSAADREFLRSSNLP